jgi:hypothetical protein
LQLEAIASLLAMTSQTLAASSNKPVHDIFQVFLLATFNDWFALLDSISTQIF